MSEYVHSARFLRKAATGYIENFRDWIIKNKLYCYEYLDYFYFGDGLEYDHPGNVAKQIQEIL